MHQLRSIQPSYPGVPHPSLQYLICTAQNANGIRTQIRNTMVSESAGRKYLGPSSQPQDRYIVARRSKCMQMHDVHLRGTTSNEIHCDRPAIAMEQ